MNIEKYENAEKLLDEIYLEESRSVLRCFEINPYDIYINNKSYHWRIYYITKSLYMPCRFKDEIIEIRQLNEY